MLTTTKSQLLNYLAIIFAGILYPLAFAPFSIWPGMFVSLSIFLWILEQPGRKTLQSFIFGLVAFTIGGSWVFVSIHIFGHAPWLFAAFMTALIIAYNALFIGLFGYCYGILNKHNYNHILLIPTLWVLIEMLRGWLFTGLPWLFVGYSQIDSPLRSYAPIVGVFGLSWLVVLISALLSDRHGNRPVQLFIIVIIFIGGFGLQKIDWVTLSPTPLKVSLVQGNVKPMDPEKLNSPLVNAQKNYEFLCDEFNCWQNSDLVLWSENTIATYPTSEAIRYVEYLDAKATANNTCLLFGMPTLINTKPVELYNSLYCLGQTRTIYHKSKLVPFGEYVPFAWLLQGINDFFNMPMSSLVSFTGNQPSIHLPKTNLAGAICWEVAFPFFIQAKIAHDPSVNMIVTLSEDGWFGDSYGPYQHLEIARMRALETGKPVLRSTSSGISAIIDHKGQIIVQSPHLQRFVITSSVFGTNGTTPWVNFGLLNLCGLILFSIIIAIYSYYRTSTRTRTTNS